MATLSHSVIESIDSLSHGFHPAQAVLVAKATEWTGLRSRRERTSSAVMLNPIKQIGVRGIRRFVSAVWFCRESFQHSQLQQQGRAASGDGVLLDG